MPNQEHLKILKQGVAAWNKNRRQELILKPHLSIAPHGSGPRLAGLHLGGSRRSDPRRCESQQSEQWEPIPHLGLKFVLVHTALFGVDNTYLESVLKTFTDG
jgi:hypothetical protein